MRLHKAWQHTSAKIEVQRLNWRQTPRTLKLVPSDNSLIKAYWSLNLKSITMCYYMTETFNRFYEAAQSSGFYLPPNTSSFMSMKPNNDDGFFFDDDYIKVL